MRHRKRRGRPTVGGAAVIAACLAAVAVSLPRAAESRPCSQYTVSGISPGMSLSDVRKRMGGGGAVDLVPGPSGPLSGVSYARGPVPVYVLYDRDISKDPAAQVVLVRARGRAGDPDPVGFVRSIVPGLGEPVLGGEHLGDGFAHGATVWEDGACGVEISAYRRPSEWWQPGSGEVFVQIMSSRFADAEAARAAGAVAPSRAGGATPSPSAAAPTELSMTLAAAEAPGAPPAAVAPPPTQGAAPPESSAQASVSAESTDPVRIAESYVPPRYPERARRMQARGSVVLRVQVRPDGSVGDIGVLEAAPKGMGFEQAAIDAVKRWRYRPATKGGKAEDAVITVRLDFG